MTNRIKKHLTYLVVADLLALILCFALLSETTSGSEQGLAFALFFMLAFLLLCLPIGLAIIGYLVQLLVDRQLQKHLLFALFFVVSFGLKLQLAYKGGFFDNLINRHELNQRIGNDPALYQLQISVSKGPRSDLNEVEKALNNGANPNASVFADAHFTVLATAVSRSDVETVRALLMHGADPNLASEMQTQSIANPRPLDLVFFSDQAGKYDVLNLLLDAGAKPEISKLPLSLCWQGEFELYKQYKRDDPTLQDLDGNRCLHLAAKNGQSTFLRQLLQQDNWETGALNAANKAGLSALDIAVNAKHYSAALALAHAGVKPNKPRTRERILEAPGDSSDLQTLQSLLMKASTNPQ